MSPFVVALVIAGCVIFGIWTYHAVRLVAEIRPRTRSDVFVLAGTPVFTTYAGYRFAADLNAGAGTIALVLLAITIVVGAYRGAVGRRQEYHTP